MEHLPRHQRRWLRLQLEVRPHVEKEPVRQLTIPPAEHNHCIHAHLAVFVLQSRENKNSWFGCYGVDTNRNWGFHWGEGGASTDTCSETYRGMPIRLHTQFVLLP
jgi:hypothetical protein